MESPSPDYHIGVYGCFLHALRACKRSCVHACVHACVRACVSACGAYVCACVRACVCAFVHLRVNACVRIRCAMLLYFFLAAARERFLRVCILCSSAEWPINARYEEDQHPQHAAERTHSHGFCLFCLISSLHLYICVSRTQINLRSKRAKCCSGSCPEKPTHPGRNHCRQLHRLLKIHHVHEWMWGSNTHSYTRSKSAKYCSAYGTRASYAMKIPSSTKTGMYFVTWLIHVCDMAHWPGAHTKSAIVPGLFSGLAWLRGVDYRILRVFYNTCPWIHVS